MNFVVALLTWSYFSFNFMKVAACPSIYWTWEFRRRSKFRHETTTLTETRFVIFRVSSRTIGLMGSTRASSSLTHCQLLPCQPSLCDVFLCDFNFGDILHYSNQVRSIQLLIWLFFDDQSILFLFYSLSINDNMVTLTEFDILS